MDTETIGKILAGLLSGGAPASIASALAEGLKLANRLMEPDPAKRSKARRDYYISLLNIIKEVQNADRTKDISDLVDAFTAMLNE